LGFLAGATVRPSLRLPVVGDIHRLSRAQRLWAASGLAFVLALLLVLLLVVLVAIVPG